MRVIFRLSFIQLNIIRLLLRKDVGNCAFNCIMNVKIQENVVAMVCDIDGFMN